MTWIKYNDSTLEQTNYYIRCYCFFIAQLLLNFDPLFVGSQPDSDPDSDRR